MEFPPTNNNACVGIKIPIGIPYNSLEHVTRSAPAKRKLSTISM